MASGLLLSACGGCGLQGDPGVKVVVPAMPTTLDWNTSDETSWVNYPVMLATQKGLTGLAADGGIGPGLASSWTLERTDAGHERYLFQLREDVKWSDGETPLRAQDFVFAWRRTLLGKERGELGEILGADRVLNLQAAGKGGTELDAALNDLAVRAVNEHALEVVLSSPRSYFLARLANVYLFFPAPSRVLEGKSEPELREYFDRPRDGHPLSLGPFRVEAWDRAGERVRLVRNPTSSFAPPLSQTEEAIERVTLLKSEVGDALFERGRVGFITVDSAAALKAKPTGVARQQLHSTYFIAFNSQRPPLNDPEVRRALSMALDREALLAELMPFPPRVTTALLPPGLPHSASAGERTSLPHFDLPGAQAVLATKPIQRPLRLVFRGGESFIPEVAIAERIKAQLARVGVQVELDARYDFAQEIARIAADGFEAHDLYLKRIGGDYAHPKTFFVLFEKGGNHRTGWERINGGKALEEFEALIRQGDAAGETPGDAYVRAERLLLERYAVVAPLYHPDRYYRVAPQLVGLGVDPFNFLSLAAMRSRAP